MNEAINTVIFKFVFRRSNGRANLLIASRGIQIGLI